MLEFGPLEDGHRTEFDDFVARSPQGNIRQTTGWTDIKSMSGWQAGYYALRRNGNLAAAAAITSRKLPRMPFSLMYCCRGPVVDWKDEEAATAVLQGLRSVVRERRGICLRADPEPAEDPGRQEALMSASGLTKIPARVTQWNRSLYSTRVPLAGPEDELFSRLRSTLRNNIRKSIKLGVTVSADAKPEDKSIFFELMAGLEERRQSIIHAKAYYDAIFELIVQHGNGYFLKAEFEGKIISGLVVALLKDKSWILYVANDYEYRHLMPNKLLYWEAIKLSRGLGCSFVDLGSTQGIPMFDPDNDSLDFLRKAYNPDVVSFPGYFDLPGLLYRPFIAAESVALPLVLKGHRMLNRLLKRGR